MEPNLNDVVHLVGAFIGAVVGGLLIVWRLTKNAGTNLQGLWKLAAPKLREFIAEAVRDTVRDEMKDTREQLADVQRRLSVVEGTATPRVAGVKR
ncbi:MAG TPA: hypothetical protein VF815_28040 [Myxococcaceae bacterium]|jgi:hypothetical protein